MRFVEGYLAKGVLKQKILGIFYPPRCPACDELLEPEEAVYNQKLSDGDGHMYRQNDESTVGDQPLYGLCASCRRAHRILPVGQCVCMHCGRPLSNDTAEYCEDCARKDLSESFLEGRSLFLYQGAVPKMMYRFKYAERQEYAQFFAAQAVWQQGDWLRRIAPQIVIPVPMYVRKKRLRGYNQAESFGRQLGLLLGIPCSDRMVRRIRNTRPMKEVGGPDERRKNLEDAFAVVRTSFPYERVLVVDDIYTTGTTADEVARVLMAAGVKFVYFLSISIGKGC